MTTNGIESRDIYDSFSPLDFRYHVPELVPTLSENGFTAYKCRVETALAETFYKRGMCSEWIAAQIHTAADRVTTAEVYAEEERIKHDIRALVNCIRGPVSNEARPFVHMTATSYDIVDTANAARFKDATQGVLVPKLTDLMRQLITITKRDADTIQVGRTHGQHAVPITFGFAMAGYVSRLGQSIEKLSQLAEDLRGKMAGAVGAYNASSLLIKDPRDFEADVLQELGLRPGEHATQIVQPEPMIRLMNECVIAGGILANLCRDMRNLQRTEIAEVGEEFGSDQVGSSTMPQKRNPISFENIEGMWKILVGRIITVLLDQISDHQRDLTNSVTTRTYGEIICYLTYMAKRLTGTMKKLRVDKDNLQKNFALQEGFIIAEPLYIILASIGHLDAYEAVRKLTLRAQAEGRSMVDLLLEEKGPDPEKIKGYIERMSLSQVEILKDPSKYIGLAADRARAIADDWQSILKIDAF